MIRTEKGKYIIEVASSFPETEAMETVNSLLRLVSSQDADMMDKDTIYDVCELIREMLPDKVE